jgi:hypothetical protein
MLVIAQVGGSLSAVNQVWRLSCPAKVTWMREGCAMVQRDTNDGLSFKMEMLEVQECRRISDPPARQGSGWFEFGFCGVLVWELQKEVEETFDCHFRLSPVAQSKPQELEIQGSCIGSEASSGWVRRSTPRDSSGLVDVGTRIRVSREILCLKS